MPVSADYNLVVTNSSSADAAQVLVGTWAVLGDDARRVREAVFVGEQGIARELEWDQWDAVAVHAVARDRRGMVIGTGRLLPTQFDPDNTGVGHIGRMAVLTQARRGGIGGLILAKLMHEARQRGCTAIVLNAQTYVAAFYAAHGFVAFGPAFLEVDIPHISMRAPL